MQYAYQFTFIARDGSLKGALRITAVLTQNTIHIYAHTIYKLAVISHPRHLHCTPIRARLATRLVRIPAFFRSHVARAQVQVVLHEIQC